MHEIRIQEINDVTVLQIVRMDCSPLPKERDSVYLNFYRLFRDTSLVAVHDGEVVGFALGMVDQTSAEHAYLNYLFVHEAYRRAGIGGKLLAGFEAAAASKAGLRIERGPRSIQSQGCSVRLLLQREESNAAHETFNDLKLLEQLPWQHAPFHYSFG